MKKETWLLAPILVALWIAWGGIIVKIAVILISVIAFPFWILLVIRLVVEMFNRKVEAEVQQRDNNK